LSLKVAPARASSAKKQDWSRERWFWLLCALTLATFLVQGFHPFAEDGGLYAAGVEFTLNRALFPHFTPFVTEHLRFSLFAPVLAAVIRLTHLSLQAVLLLTDLASIALTLIAARAILRRAVTSERAQLAGLALLSALWTLPVAATSLFIMDPYVTARSFSTPLSLFAIAFALDPWPFPAPGRVTARSGRTWRSFASCATCLALAIFFHPLMAGYALGLIFFLRLARARNSSAIFFLAALTLALAAVLQTLAPIDRPNLVAASLTRYYWFLSQWRWYERLGLVCPLLVLAAFRRWLPLRTPGQTLCRAALALGLLASVVALLFAHEIYRSHLIARLQPLRCFLPIYAVMVLFLGAMLEEIAAYLATRATSGLPRRLLGTLPALLIVGTAIAMFAVQRVEFPADVHIDLPWRAQPANPWTQAFLWCRAHTPVNALFALDAHYIYIPGEDAQTFRAIAQRSALPDFSKDGGEAAITPALADQWAAGVAAQLNLSRESDAARLAHLQAYKVDWLVLPSTASTAMPCPYDNSKVKVCRLAH
jgi:hypothetical protein